MENDSLIRPNAIMGIILVVGFISFPAMLVIVTAMMLRENQACPAKNTRYLIYVLLGTALGYINTTKPTEYSDVGYYFWLYNWASTKTFSEYVDLIPKEPLFHIYNYVMSYLTFGNFKLFLVATTILMYLPVMLAFDKIICENKIESKYAIAAAVIFACFSEYFYYTAQIIRQVLAGSLAFYFVVRMTYKNDKWSYIGLACTGLIHASAFVFCIYYILRFSVRWSLKVRLIVVLASFVLFGAIVGFVASMSDPDSTLAYAANRALSGAGDVIHIGLLPLAVCASIIPMALLIMQRLEWDTGITNIMLLAVFLVVFVFANMSNPLFVLRFMEYCYIFLPICLVLSLYLLQLTRIIFLAIVIILFRFVMSLNKGDFQYEPFINICIDGYPSMLFKILG